MKVIGKDNFDRESVAEFQIPGLIRMPEENAKAAAKWLNQVLGGEQANTFYEAVPDEYKLWKGMEEFI